MVRLEGVNKEYRVGRRHVRALSGVNLQVERGEFLAVSGTSGSGKSTLLSLIGLLATPSSGRIEIGGREVQGMSERERTLFRLERLGFVFQFPSLVNTLNVRENVLLPKLLTGRVSDADRLKAEALLAEVGLAGRGEDRSWQLSGGEQRRVALARALFDDPELIVADEPTGALDEGTAGEILRLFERLRSAGRTIVMATHDPACRSAAKRVVTLHDGVMEE
jgi:ABC-type lipoprotein export system ATPase subunit